MLKLLTLSIDLEPRNRNWSLGVAGLQCTELIRLDSHVDKRGLWPRSTRDTDFCAGIELSREYTRRSQKCIFEAEEADFDQERKWKNAKNAMKS